MKKENRIMSGSIDTDILKAKFGYLNDYNNSQLTVDDILGNIETKVNNTNEVSEKKNVTLNNILNKEIKKMSNENDKTGLYKKEFEIGKNYEGYVATKLKENLDIRIDNYYSSAKQYNIGENKQGMEIKNDRNIKRTGNIYIEIAEKSNPKNKNFVPSGIFRMDNSVIYAIGNEERIYFFKISELRKYFDNNYLRIIETPTSKGFLLKVAGIQEHPAYIGEWKFQ